MVAPRVIRLGEKFGLFKEHWKPKIIAELNDSYLKAVKVKGEFIWHHHDTEDELFLVTKGRLTIKLKDKDLQLRGGENLSSSPEVWSASPLPKRRWNSFCLNSRRP